MYHSNQIRSDLELFKDIILLQLIIILHPCDKMFKKHVSFLYLRLGQRMLALALLRARTLTVSMFLNGTSIHVFVSVRLCTCVCTSM